MHTDTNAFDQLTAADRVALSEQLTADGITLTSQQVHALVRGVASSALSPADQSWLGLIAAKPSRGLKALLTRLRGQVTEDARVTEAPHPAVRLGAVRREMQRNGLSALIVGHGDPHGNEMLQPSERHLEWLTDFTGSAGTAVLLQETAALFVDGRYTLQARGQVDSGLWRVIHSADVAPTDWLKDSVARGGRIGFDAWRTSLRTYKRLERIADNDRFELVPLEQSPVRVVWTNRPAEAIGPVRVQPDAVTGQSSADKRKAVAETLHKDGLDAVVLAATDSIAWLLNLRGSDVACTPVIVSFAILYANGTVDWFVDQRKLTPDVRTAVGRDVSVHEPDRFHHGLDMLGRRRAVVGLDLDAPVAIRERLIEDGASVREVDDPCALPKACKTKAEIAGMERAHRRDGVAMARFLAWLEREVPRRRATEQDAVDQATALRAAQSRYAGISFDAIAGSGPNGAIVHYRVTPDSNRLIRPGECFLFDSGAQYQDGTTDITRTVVVGRVQEAVRRAYTLVLKGHLAVGMAVFPEGTTGAQIDALARHPLWQHGLDFDHGTGHGVGAYLSVHEGPQRLSKASDVALKPGMILSNEPGYYRAGAFGIRIENLMVVTQARVRGAERPMLGFKTLTLCPYARNLIDLSLLTEDEIGWIDAYHARVHKTLAPALEETDRRWLDLACAAL